MKDLTCARVRDLLPELMAGILDAAHRDTLNAHLQRCSECAAEARLVAAMAAASVPVPSGLEARVLAAVHTRPVVRPWAAPGRLALAATVAAAVIGGSLLFESNREGPQPNPAVPPLAEEAIPTLRDPLLGGGSVLAELTEAELEALLEQM